MKILCECNSFTCAKTVDIPFKKAEGIKLHPDFVIIVEGCSPEPTDILVEKEIGYSIYREMK